MMAPRVVVGGDGGLAGGAGEVGGDDVGGVSVEGGVGAVVAHGGSRIGVGGGLLDVTQRDAGVEGGGDEGVAQGVWADRFGDACSLATWWRSRLSTIL
jgi:hypothetical protein